MILFSYSYLNDPVSSLGSNTKHNRETLSLCWERFWLTCYKRKDQDLTRSHLWGLWPNMFWSHVAKHTCTWPKHFTAANKPENICSTNTSSWSVRAVISTSEVTWWQIRVCRSSLLDSSRFYGRFCVLSSASVGRVRTTAFMVILFLF